MKRHEIFLLLVLVLSFTNSCKKEATIGFDYSIGFENTKGLET